MSEMERVWVRIKSAAEQLGTAGRRLSQRQAEGIVADIMREEHAERPPLDALQYLAEELRSRTSAHVEETHSTT
jgi:hypothetical protein